MSGKKVIAVMPNHDKLIGKIKAFANNKPIGIAQRDFTCDSCLFGAMPNYNQRGIDDNRVSGG